MLTFKQIFPTNETFHKYLVDYSIYYTADEYTAPKALIYWTLLYRKYGNSHTVYDQEVFFEQMSLIIAENFREFFIIRKLLDIAASQEVNELLIGMEVITNVADNPNYTTEPNEVLKHIGQQSRTRSKENLVDRVNSLVKKINVAEVTREVDKYKDLFIRVIPRFVTYYEEEDNEY